MSEKPVSVGLIGIPAMEERRLQVAFKYSKSRRLTYQAEMLRNDPQILMVNNDDTDALDKWHDYCEQLKCHSKTEPVLIFVSRDKKSESEHYQLCRPLITSRVISALDQVTNSQLQIANDVAIETDTPAQPQQVEASRTTEEEQVAYPECRVLVVDDSLPVRIQMGRALKKHVAQVDFAETGEEAFEHLSNNIYNIIFLDIVLPGLDGYEVCKVIKQGPAKDVPVIMLTGNTSASDKIKGKLSGCDTYLIKPVGQFMFNEVVQQYLCHTETEDIGTKH